MPEDVLTNVRKAISGKGIFAVGKLKNAFLLADKNHNGVLSRDEFVWCVKESGVDLTATEFNKLFRYFDKNFDDQVSYREFVEFFSVPLGAERHNLVVESFNRLAGGQKTIDFVTVSHAFDPREDPEVSLSIVSP